MTVNDPGLEAAAASILNGGGDPEVDALLASLGDQVQPQAPQQVVAPQLPQQVVAPQLPQQVVAPQLPQQVVAPQLPQQVVAPQLPQQVVAPQLPQQVVAPQLPGQQVVAPQTPIDQTVASLAQQLSDLKAQQAQQQQAALLAQQQAAKQQAERQARDDFLNQIRLQEQPLSPEAQADAAALAPLLDTLLAQRLNPVFERIVQKVPATIEGVNTAADSAIQQFHNQQQFPAQQALAAQQQFPAQTFDNAVAALVPDVDRVAVEPRFASFLATPVYPGAALTFRDVAQSMQQKGDATGMANLINQYKQAVPSAPVQQFQTVADPAIVPRANQFDPSVNSRTLAALGDKLRSGQITPEAYNAATTRLAELEALAAYN